MRCCQYIMGDRDRFDDQGLTETGLSSSISNLFVSAVILTDKQSACNITSTLTESDSASTRHEKMALSEWIGNKQKSIQKTLLKKTRFSETIFLEKPVNLCCCFFSACMCVQARGCFRIYIAGFTFSLRHTSRRSCDRPFLSSVFIRTPQNQSSGQGEGVSKGLCGLRAHTPPSHPRDLVEHTISSLLAN